MIVTVVSGKNTQSTLIHMLDDLQYFQLLHFHLKPTAWLEELQYV